MVRVTLLTDFGTADGYAAAMAGVIATGAAGAVIEHASHAIEPGDVFAAALALSRYWRLYPEGTVHVVVVDPGVGTRRRALAARADRRYLVGPDNGVLGLALAAATDSGVVEIRDEALLARASATFHGRDVFAPAAARLAAGAGLESLGPAVNDAVGLRLPAPVTEEGAVRGEVLAVDRFGNLITSVPAAAVGAGAAVAVDGRDVGPVRRTYGDVEEGELLALIGSLDLLEVSVRNGRAADRLGCGRGTTVVVRAQG